MTNAVSNSTELQQDLEVIIAVQSRDLEEVERLALTTNKKLAAIERICLTDLRNSDLRKIYEIIHGEDVT